MSDNWTKHATRGCGFLGLIVGISAGGLSLFSLVWGVTNTDLSIAIGLIAATLFGGIAAIGFVIAMVAFGLRRSQTPRSQQSP